MIKKPIAEDIKYNHIIRKEGHGLRKSEDCRFDKSFDNANYFTIPGTDNGVKKLRTSVRFSNQRFEFHLDIYKIYSPETKQTNVTLWKKKHLRDQKKNGSLIKKKRSLLN